MGGANSPLLYGAGYNLTCLQRIEQKIFLNQDFINSVVLSVIIKENLSFPHILNLSAFDLWTS